MKFKCSTLSFSCDADPAALSKYVLALIKKDKPLEDLKESMAQQMDVFLQVRISVLIE
jgi:RNA-binding protein 26